MMLCFPLKYDFQKVFTKNLYCRYFEFQIDNPCRFNQCDELCLLNKQKKYTCACTLDKTLNPDGHTCRGKFAKNTKSLGHTNISHP